MAADAGMKEEVEALRLSILAAARPPADEDPTLRQLALAALDRTRIAEAEVARWRDAVAALYAALEAGGHVEVQAPEGSAPSAPGAGAVDG